MSIPVHVSAVRVFDDRVDLVVRGAEGVLVNLRLSRQAAEVLAEDLRLADPRGGEKAVPATLDHPPAPAAGVAP